MKSHRGCAPARGRLQAAKALSRCTTRASPRRTSGPPRTLWGACVAVVPKHTRHEMSGADTGVRTRGLDHGVVALCQLSYIRLGARCRRQKAHRISRQLVKEQSGVHRTAVRPGGAQVGQAGRPAGNKKARILSEPGPRHEFECEGVRLKRPPRPVAIGPRDRTTHWLAGLGRDPGRVPCQTPHPWPRTPAQAGPAWAACNGWWGGWRSR